MDTAELGSKGYLLAMCDLADRKSVDKVGRQGSTVLAGELGQRSLKTEPVVPFFQLVRHKLRCRLLAGIYSVDGIELAPSIVAEPVQGLVASNRCQPGRWQRLPSESVPFFPGFLQSIAPNCAGFKGCRMDRNATKNWSKPLLREVATFANRRVSSYDAF
jgi:hypothetical protein